MYTLPPLPYAYDALEPYIDARTMEIHYTKHHQAYIDNLNKALQKHPALFEKTLDELLQNLAELPEDIRAAVRNNGGGHFNHSLFWTMMSPHKNNSPRDKVAHAIQKTFGSVDRFKQDFTAAAKERFGSGWAWLALDTQGKLIVTSSANQDTPISEDQAPILGLDVWEHAYYLKYQNKRVDYIESWWHVVNWNQVEENYRLLGG
jgi:Fe-Mn family superoxide dismutase